MKRRGSVNDRCKQKVSSDMCCDYLWHQQHKTKLCSPADYKLPIVFQSTVLPPVVRDVMMLLSEYREVTTCYGFRSAQRRLSAKVGVGQMLHVCALIITMSQNSLGYGFELAST